MSLAQKKGPLPPVPSMKSSMASQKEPQATEGVDQSPPPPAPVPVVPESIGESASFKDVRDWDSLHVVSVLNT